MTVGPADRSIEKIEFDSRKVNRNDVFVAVKGTQVDGHVFIQKAIDAGAAVVVCEHLPTNIIEGKTYLQVTNSAKALSEMANCYYNHPSHDIQLVGVTGTNGKTTTATLLHSLFSDLGYKVGLLSTIENKIGQKRLPATHTTPDAIALNALIAQMVEEGCDYAFMEVSSHAIHQHRVSGLHFAGGVFTNISHDHLDYHGSFKEYINAKKAFFDNLPKTAFALTNVDDKRGMVMMQNTEANILTYSLRRMADYKGRILENSFAGLHFDINGTNFYSRLIGQFNGYNLLAIYATAMQLGQDEMEVLTELSQIQTAEGRFEYIIHPEKGTVGIVDYAHTPDALEKVLSTISQIVQGASRVITVVGCGGDRDRTKRPKMAKVACDYSHQVILTSDNPRTEVPDAIIEEMEVGIPPYATNKTLSITNRKQAIKTACQLAQPGDIILVAGKGHEKYQEINGVKHNFDDKAELKAAFQM